MFTVNLYYTGKNGAAHRFAEEMESSGTASAIRGKPDSQSRALYVRERTRARQRVFEIRKGVAVLATP